jgi:transposase InsO family protein
MGKRTGAAYTKMPEVPTELASRLEAVLKVLSDRSNISAEAQALGMTRVQMQTLVHRGVEGLIQGLTPRAPGPKPPSETEAALREENEQLRRDMRSMQSKVEMTERFLSVAGDLIRTRSGPSRSTGTSKTKKTKRSTGSASEDDEGQRAARLAAASVLLEQLPMSVIAPLRGTSVSSLLRWRRRARAGTTLCARRRGRVRETTSLSVRRAEDLVRDSHGLIGADALRIAIGGISRREALAIKCATVTAMERERRARARRVEVLMPGVVRGFDAMHLVADGERRYALIAADAAIPFRTSTMLVDRYDESNVLAALEADFVANGAPLVLRLDRGSCQRTLLIVRFLEARGVIALHGPARHPGDYGQTERQNRDHRAWLDLFGEVSNAELALRLDEMRELMNERLPRRALGWNTPAAVWTQRPVLSDDRAELRDEVEAMTAKIAASMRRVRESDENRETRARRFAIEGALVRRGHLRIR